MQADWTDPKAYEHMRGHEAAEFAAEYLIRNDEFVSESSGLALFAADGELVGSATFAARWGARFRRRGRQATYC